MQTIGILGGLSWVSTMEYYRIINTETNRRVGGVHAAKILIHSLDYGEIVQLTLEDNWEKITSIACEAAQGLEDAGAGFLLVGANTMHRIADKIQDSISIPLLHIADVTAQAIREKGMQKVALLGTRFTMEMEFYPKALSARGITQIIPNDADREYIHQSIYNELGRNVFLPEMRERYITIIKSLAAAGAEGVILGCTEIPQLISQEDSPLPVFDTALLHSIAAVNKALDGVEAGEGEKFY